MLHRRPPLRPRVLTETLSLVRGELDDKKFMDRIRDRTLHMSTNQ